MLLISAALLAVTIALMRYLLRWSARDAAGGERIQERAIGGNPFAGLRLVFSSGYLMGIAAFVFLMAAVTTFLYLQQAALLKLHFPDGSERTAFLGKVDLTVNLIAVVLQLLAIGRLIRRFGVTAMLVAVPVVMIGGFLVLSVAPTLAVLVTVYIVRRVGQYGITRPAREILFTTLDREAKYKAKNLIDTAVYRSSDFLVAKGHDAVVSALAATLSGIAWLGAGVAAVWAVVAFLLGRAHERMAAVKPPA